MTSTPPESLERSRLYCWLVRYGTDTVAVLLSASLLMLPIENGAYWPLAFVALVPLLLRVWTRSYWAVFFMSFAVFYLYLYDVLHWITVYGYHWRIILVFMNALGFGVTFVIAFWLLRRYKSHFYATILPTLMVLLEFRQSLGFFAFPWPLLCHTQYANLPLIQIAAVAGCWGVTFLIVHVNEALAHLIAGGFKPRILPVAIVPVILIGASGFYGALALARTLPAPEIPVTLVQGSEPTNIEWTREFNIRSIDEYIGFTIDEFTPDPASQELQVQYIGSRLVIWPETSIPNAVKKRHYLEQIRALASSLDATFLVGCLTWDPADGIPLDLETFYQPRSNPGEYNSLVAFEPNGAVIPVHSKIQVVPFGEVIPMKEVITGWFPDYYWGARDITPGTGYHAVETGVGRIAAVVCYESFIPQITRNAVKEGADILVLVSNTSWCLRTRASYQHARFDVFRAVENGIWFCRAATTGISSIIDPRGNVWVETELFKGGAVTVQVARKSGTTLYTRWGDWLPLMCGVYWLVLVLGAFLVREEDSA